MQIRRSFCSVLVALSTVFVITDARAQQVLYGADSSGHNLLAIDPATAAPTVIGPFGNLTLGSIAWDRTSGLLYGTDTSIGGKFYTLDPATGAATFVGNTGINLLHGLAFHPYTGVLYAVNSTSSLYKINKLTAAATLVGNVGLQNINALEFDPTTGVLYGAQASASSTGFLITIDVQTGVGTLVASTNRINGLAFDASGALFASQNGLFPGNPNVLFSVDKHTGAWSLIGTINTGNVLGLTFSEIYPRIPFCFGDGSTVACPCGNAGAIGRGCENSAATGGAQLSASGVASTSTDTLQLTTAGELAGSLSMVLQGDAAIAPAIFGDGLRCAGGALKQLRVENAVGGTIVYPDGGETGVHAQSASLGDVIAHGATRIYQVYYRDPSLGFCPAPPGNAFNATNAIAIAWMN